MTPEEQHHALQSLVASGFSAESTSSTRNNLLNKYKQMLSDVQTVDAAYREALELARSSKETLQGLAANLSMVEELLLTELAEIDAGSGEG